MLMLINTYKSVTILRYTSIQFVRILNLWIALPKKNTKLNVQWIKMILQYAYIFHCKANPTFQHTTVTSYTICGYFFGCIAS